MRTILLSLYVYLKIDRVISWAWKCGLKKEMNGNICELAMPNGSMTHATNVEIAIKSVAIFDRVKFVACQPFWHHVPHFQPKNANEDPLNACMSNENAARDSNQFGCECRELLERYSHYLIENKVCIRSTSGRKLNGSSFRNIPHFIPFLFFFSNSFENHERSNCYRKKKYGKISACWNSNYFLGFCPFFPFVIWIFGL